MNAWVFVIACVAGGVGATLRWLIDTVISDRFRYRFPLGVFIINVTGSFALGIVVTALSPDLSEIIGTGLLGGYTTFSTVAVASAVLAKDGAPRIALLNIVGTFIACVLAALGGVALGNL